MNKRTANKGEWSELYVFFKIVLDRIVYAADANMVPKRDEWFKFIKLYKSINNGKSLIYDLTDEKIVKIHHSKTEIEIVDELNLRQTVTTILDTIKKQKSTFAVQDAGVLMNAYSIDTVKAKSISKSDIDADVIVSNNTGIHRMGFSVKSYIGGAPTLVNASSHTNFIYEIVGFNGDIQAINGINTRFKVRDRITEILEQGGQLEFSHMQSDIFRHNLRLQDSTFPIVLARIVQYFYSGKGNDFEILGTLVAKDSDLDVNETEIKTMVKRYLRSSALGMVPGTAWEGTLSAQGGYIVVLENGQLLCYNIYFDDDFQSYLYSNTKLDTPSTKKYNFGKIYIENNKLYIKFNLQIRFK